MSDTAHVRLDAVPERLLLDDIAVGYSQHGLVQRELVGERHEQPVHDTVESEHGRMQLEDGPEFVARIAVVVVAYLDIEVVGGKLEQSLWHAQLGKQLCAQHRLVRAEG